MNSLLCVFCWLSAGLALCLMALADSRADAAQPTSAKNVSVEKSVEKDGVQLTLTLDRDTAEVADPMSIELRVAAPTGTLITLPTWPAEIGDLRLRQTANLPDIPAGKLRVWKQRYEIVSLSPGKVELPPAKITYRLSNPNAQTQPLELPPLSLSFTSLVSADADPTKFRDIKGAVEIPAPPTGFQSWGLLASGLTSLVALIVLWKLWFRRKPLSADQWAIAELNRIHVSQMIAQDRVQELYFLVTGVVRTYIERRFGIRAPNKTTAEFLSEVQQHPLLAGPYRMSLAEFLELADRVKFARWNPEARQIEATVAGAKSFVESTAESTHANPPRRQGLDQNQSSTPLAHASSEYPLRLTRDF
ncbi:MAG: hypothetical protein IT427_14440 [Pirellulales bacterium]|nr:hypothetical protein [Pirellulales bacterium]